MNGVNHRIRLLAAAVGVVLAAGCSSSTSAGRAPTPSTRVQVPADRVVVTGIGRVGGEAVTSRFVGAVVLRDGLVTPCQAELPPIRQGRFRVGVLADTVSAGCLAHGARLALWTFVRDSIVYSTNTVAWNSNARSLRFDPSFSVNTPNGAVPPLAQFQGSVLGTDGRVLGPPHQVSAFIGDTRCGIASVRSSPEFTGYILAVVGPDSVPGCRREAPISFRVDGRAVAATSAVNTPPGINESLDLHVT